MMRVSLVLFLLAIGPSVDAFGFPKSSKTRILRSSVYELPPRQGPLYLRDDDNNNNNDENDRFEPPILPQIAAFSRAFCLATALWFAGGSHSAAAAALENEYLSITEADIAIQSNKKLIDYAVGTVNTQFYDNSGGARFNPSDFYRQWKDVQKTLTDDNDPTTKQAQQSLRIDTREGTVDTLRYLIGSLKDPYSKYMTREELRYELKGSHDGFLGTGAYIEVPKSSPAAAPTESSSTTTSRSSSSLQSTLAHNRNREQQTFRVNIARESLEKKTTKSKHLLTNTKVANLPVVTAVAPNSPAERAGLVVGDRIVGVGDKDTFVGYGRDEIRKCLAKNWGYGITSSTASSSKQYFGVADLTIAKPVYYLGTVPENDDESSSLPPPEIVMGYRSTKVKLPTKATETTTNNDQTELRGDSVVQYELLTASRSIFGNLSPRADDNEDVGLVSSRQSPENENDTRVGYIRLTRFSKSSTEGYLQAVQALEDEGADSYVIDLRNNYGGVIQEAMLTASTVIGDPHALLCYLLNARGGFTPVDVESYVVDPKYPGYLLSKEPKSIVLEQVMKERPGMFRTVKDDTAVATTDRNNNNNHHVDSLPLLQGQGGKRIVVDWDPPSSYASIHEQVAKRGIHRISYVNYEPTSEDATYGSAMPNRKSSSNNNDAVAYRQRQLQQKLLQKDIVLLINEGTASSAEFFTAALQDNGRSLAVVGTKSFGKGLIQHTFPMPDGGGLKLTIGEFLRPSLKHVTNPFWDRDSSVAGGIRPDVYCDSKQGIPGNPKADLCVGVALDVFEEAKSIKASTTTTTTTANGSTPRTKAVSSSTTMISGSSLR